VKPKKPVLSVAVLRGITVALRHVVTDDNWMYKHAGANNREDMRRALDWAAKMTEYRKLPESVRNSRSTGNPVPEAFSNES
jgi:hypothetical protein